ncbi:MAG: hypothetical protein V7676_16445 [Parasphingorhabdus sp.]|uniref:hypothetical protein n=1 Tax=Parasphingorhabdus sp. TaxID=2709688 RepID=UPI003003A275
MTLMDNALQILDLAIIAFALASGWLWLAASRRRLRRVSIYETLNAADYNRIITALNRTQILNSRAAISTGIAAFMAALRIIFYEVSGD